MAIIEETEAPAWLARAACAGRDTDAFYPSGLSRVFGTRAAKAVCGACPVREDCLQFALDNDEAHGIWGGRTERERRALARHR